MQGSTFSLTVWMYLLELCSRKARDTHTYIYRQSNICANTLWFYHSGYP